MLIGREIASLDAMREAAKAMAGLGVRRVVVKGGHMAGDSTDVFYDGSTFMELPARRIETTSTHGTGCKLAAAIAALLARGEPLESAITGAKAYVTAAIEQAYPDRPRPRSCPPLPSLVVATVSVLIRHRARSTPLRPRVITDKTRSSVSEPGDGSGSGNPWCHSSGQRQPV